MKMKMRKSECRPEDEGEPSSSGRPKGRNVQAECGRRRATSGAPKIADADGVAAATEPTVRAGQKSAFASSRRLSDLLDRYQCDEDCPLAVGGGASSVKGVGPDTVAAAAADGGIQWPDEVVRRVAEEGMRQRASAKHIHPCVCDLSKKQRANVEQYLSERRAAQRKFERRVREIEEEIRLAEEAEQQRLRELEAEKEFYGDEYEMEGSTRKRKKRSARRASMVSLGVKQIISWRKPPKIEVKYTRTSNMRSTSGTYCKPPLPPLPQIRPVNVNFEQPEIPIRANRTVELRLKFIKNHIHTSKERQVKVKYPDRPPFVTQYW